MKRIYLILCVLLFSVQAFSQTTPWSSSPPVTPQTRFFSGAKQIRWLWGSNTLYSLDDSLAKYKLKADSVNNSGYVTHGYFNAHAHSYNFLNGLVNDGSDNTGLGGDLSHFTLTDLHQNSLIYKTEYLQTSAPFNINVLDQFSYNSYGWIMESYRLKEDHSVLYSKPIVQINFAQSKIGIETGGDGNDVQALRFSIVPTTTNSTPSSIILHDDLRKGILVDWASDTNLSDSSYVPKRYVTAAISTAGAGFAVKAGGNSFTGSQYMNATSVMTTPDSIAFLGDSYIAGFGVLAYQRMSTVAAGKLNAIEVNLGVGGSTVEEQSPTMPFGVSSYVARRATIPVYNSHYLALVINGSINDPTLNSANYNVTNYTADLGTNIVDYAVSVRGWPAGKILLVSQPYKSPTSYVSRNGNPAATDVINISFANATKAVATAKGTRYLDQYNLLKNNGGKLLEQVDSLHLNPSGHRIVGNAIANAVGLIIKQNGQQLAVNGLTQLSKIRLSSTDTLQSKGHAIIVADSLGNIVYAPNKYISNVSDTTAANAQGANLNVNGVVRGGNLIANQIVKALGPLLTGSYLNSASAGTYPTNKLGLYLLGSAARGFIDSYSTTSANTGNQLDIQSQSLGDVNIYGNINFKSTGKLTTLSSPLILNTYLQIPNATGVYPGTKTGGLITANITAMYIDAFSSSGGVGLPLFLNNQSTQAVQSYGSFSVMNAKAFNVGTGVSTFGGPVFVTPFTSAGVVTNNGSAQLVSSPSLSVILGGSGQTSYTNGQLLIGNTTGNTLTKATLTASAATGLLIANGLGSITISNDTTVLLTVANTFPKNDTRYQKITTAFTNPMSTLGDIIYGGASGAATRLAGNTTTTQKFLTSTGNGTVSAAPAYFDLFGGNNTWGGNNTLNGALNLNGGANFKGGIASAFYNTANTFSINLGVNTVTANRNITLPDASGELLLNTSGSFSGTGTATTTFTVTIGVTQANTTYKVNVTPTSLVAAAVFYVNNKTTTTFDVVYPVGLSGAVSFDWALFK